MRRFAACMSVGLLAACLSARVAEGLSADVNGFIDVTYNMNLNDPPGPPTPDTLLHLYDADVNTWLLNMAHLEISGSFSSEVDYVVEIDAGYDALINSLLSVGIPYYVELQEAYIRAKSEQSRLGLMIGKFATFEGIEQIEAPENATLSRGLLYTYAEPVTHTGALLTYTGEDDAFDVAIGVVNGWDVLIDNNDDQTFLAKLEMSPNKEFDLTLTYMSGPEDAAGDYDRTSLDVTAGIKLERKTTLYLQYNRGTEETAGADEEWSGFGVQFVFEPSEDFSLGLRFESFTDEDDVRVGLGPPAGDGTYTNFTIAPAFRLSETTTLRFEIRMDQADWDAFDDDAGAPTDSQTTVGVEVFCTF